MRRYWKIILLTIVIVTTLGIFYIQGAIAEKDLPTLEIATVSGDEKEKENVVINGSLVVNSIGESFKLSSEGTTYASELNYWDRKMGFYHHPTLDRLIEEQRGFMRGKTFELDMLYEDDEKLIYVGPPSPTQNDFELDVEVLDKKTNDKQGFSVKMPNKEIPDHVQIMEVQLVEDAIHVFTANYNGGMEQIHMYQIDISEEKIMEHKPLIDGKDNGYVGILNHYGDISKKPYLVISVDYTEWDEERIYEEVIATEYIAYNTKTGEQHMIERMEHPGSDSYKPGQEASYFNEGYSMKDEFLYFYSIVPEGLKVETYSFENGEMESTNVINLEEGVINGVYSEIPQGEKLYFFSDLEAGSNKTNNLFIADLQNGELTYQGEIKLANATHEMTVYDIEFYDVVQGSVPE